MPTALGWTLISMPTDPPAPQSMEFTAIDTVAASLSPFTGQQQIQYWQTARLEASVSMPPLTHVQAQAFIAFLLALQGQANVFQLGDPLARTPQGTGAGTPVVSGANQTGFTLNTSGWSGSGALLPGDWLQIGFRLYRNLGVVNSGAQTLSIWPQIRESPADGATITVTNTKGLWRLSSSMRKWSLTEARLYGVQIDIREAL